MKGNISRGWKVSSLVGAIHIVEISDILTFEEIDRITSKVCSNYDFDNIKFIIHDLTAVTSLEISNYELEVNAYIYLAITLYKKKLKNAFVIKCKKIEDAANYYIETSKNIGNPWEQKIFLNIDDALIWANN